MDDEPIKESDLYSDCCGARVYSNTDLCSECKEHCSTHKEGENEMTLGSMDRF